MSLSNALNVKQVQANPKAGLNLQTHRHRAEHWVEGNGAAEITNGDQRILWTEHQAPYNSLGKAHRLTNPGTIPRGIMEVHSGSYLDEDDIVRFEDSYGRN